MARMLIIDDEASIRRLLHTVLTRKGHEVFLADNGPKGIAVFKRVRPLITVVDLNMPGVGGIEVVRCLRAADPQARVIILTGAGTAEAESDARALGVDEFLTKGFSLLELGEALRRALARSTEGRFVSAAAEQGSPQLGQCRTSS